MNGSEMKRRKRKHDLRDLLHSAQESRVAPRLRFLAGSGPGDGSRLLGDGVDIRVGIGNEEAWIEAWRYKGRRCDEPGAIATTAVRSWNASPMRP
jgi:hypothetical protein